MNILSQVLAFLPLLSFVEKIMPLLQQIGAQPSTVDGVTIKDHLSDVIANHGEPISALLPDLQNIVSAADSVLNQQPNSGS